MYPTIYTLDQNIAVVFKGVVNYFFLEHVFPFDYHIAKNHINEIHVLSSYPMSGTRS